MSFSMNDVKTILKKNFSQMKMPFKNNSINFGNELNNIKHSFDLKQIENHEESKNLSESSEISYFGKIINFNRNY